MARKQRTILIEPQEFRVFLVARMAVLGLSAVEMAKEMGVSQATVYTLLDGKLQPTEKILDRVGLELVYRVVPRAPADFTPHLIERNDFRLLLASRMMTEKVPAPAMAAQLGISRATLYGLLSGEMKPSENILEKMGLKPVFRLKQLGGETGTISKGARRKK